MNRPPSYDLREVPLKDVRALFERFHKYKSVGGTATYCFGVLESSGLVAAYTWQPPAPGAALSVCPEAPAGVLALSRMVAVPKTERHLKHVSKPLMEQMRKLIDRTRWPVLVTYSDSSLGHTGYVYQCSGWEKTSVSTVPFYLDATGARVSSYSNGARTKREGLTFGGWAELQRWEHWVCDRGEAKRFMEAAGWFRVPIDGKRWKSGAQAHTFIQVPRYR